MILRFFHYCVWLCAGVADAVVIVLFGKANCCKVFLTLSNRSGSLCCKSRCRIRCTPISFNLFWRSIAPSSADQIKLDTTATEAICNSTELYVYSGITKRLNNKIFFHLDNFQKKEKKFKYGNRNKRTDTLDQSY